MRSLRCLCVFVFIPPVVARQRLCKHVPTEMNTHAAIKELFETSFSMRSMYYQRKWAIISVKFSIFIALMQGLQKPVAVNAKK
jgi:hypothetical protein